MMVAALLARLALAQLGDWRAEASFYNSLPVDVAASCPALRRLAIAGCFDNTGILGDSIDATVECSLDYVPAECRP